MPVLRPLAAAGLRSCAEAVRHERRIEAGQQPARARAVDPTEEREIHGREGTSGRKAERGRSLEDRGLPGVAAGGPATTRSRRRAPPERTRWSSSRVDRFVGKLVANGKSCLVRRVRLQPAASRREAFVEDRPLACGQRAALLGLDMRDDVHSRDLDEQREVSERRAERRRLGRHIGVRVEEGVPEGRLVTGRDLALDLPTGGRRRIPVELVEETRDGVGAFGRELDRLVRPWPDEEEPELLGRDDLDDRVSGGAASLGRRHLLAADVEELVRDVERRLAFEHLPGDRVGAIARTAGRGEVLASGFDRDPEERPLGRPFEVPGQLRRAAERADPARRAAAARPLDEVRPALEEDPLAVPVGDDRGADLAAGRADDPERMPVVGVLDVRDAAIDVADERRPDRAPAGCTDPPRRSGRCRSSSSSGRGGCRAPRTSR